MGWFLGSFRRKFSRVYWQDWSCWPFERVQWPPLNHLTWCISNQPFSKAPWIHAANIQSLPQLKQKGLVGFLRVPGVVQGEGVFLGNPKDSVWDDWGNLGEHGLLGSIKNWMGPNSNGPRSVSCEIERLDTQVFFRGPWKVGPVRDFLDWRISFF